MKRKLIAITLLAAMAMALTACGKNKSEEAAETTPTTEIVTESQASAQTEADILLEDDTNLDELIPNTSEEITDETPADTEAAASSNSLMPIIDKALAESEWPMMAEVTDTTILQEFFKLDSANENYTDMIVMQCPISATMSEIIIINAVDVDLAKADLEARQTKAIEQDAWYPNDVELAQASIVGTNGSYAYFIIGENAAAAETSINDYINSL